MMDAAVVPVPVDASDASAFLERALVRARAASEGRTGTLVISVPAPCADALSMWEAIPNEPAWLWEAAAEPSVATAGVAAEVQGQGSDRFAQVLAGVRRDPVLCQIRHPLCADVPAPRWFGGFAFLPGAAREPVWSSFGDAHFVLPRWTYTRRGNHASLSLVTSSRADACTQAPVDEYGALLNALRVPRDGTVGAPWCVERQEQVQRDAWVHLVQEAKRRIVDGSMRKVVLARRSLLEADRGIEAARVLATLRRAHPQATLFGVRLHDRAFVGATPELLVRLRGRHVHTEALAGTCPADAASCGQALLDSHKDRHEQALVTEAILARLAPRCERLHAAAEPLAHRAGHLLHLRTAIEGVLRDDAHVLELVEQLHPTPAVGGLPRTEALRWLSENEPVPRGWYASPVGWIDSSGDGEFVVALRSGLLHANQAWLYAGAGIVSGSDPCAEFEETGWKLRVMGGALGATREESAQ